jgi:hypothetical protein
MTRDVAGAADACRAAGTLTGFTADRRRAALAPAQDKPAVPVAASESHEREAGKHEYRFRALHARPPSGK